MKLNDTAIEISIKCAIKNCHNIEGYRQLIVFDKHDFSFKDLEWLLNKATALTRYSTLVGTTVVDRFSGGMIDFYDISSYRKDIRGKKYHNVIYLCPASEEDYVYLVPTLVPYKNMVKCAPENTHEGAN